MTEGVGEHVRPEVDDFGLSAVRELLQLLSQTDITEIQIERGGSRLHIKRSLPVAAPIAAAPTMAVAPTTAQALPLPTLTIPSSAGEGDHLLPGQSTITAPMVGTYYAAPSPKDKPYVEEGDIIQPGDRVGLVEAMKMMNEIESEVAGRIVRLLVKNGQPVEYGQVLMVVEPI
jgi:acetyl-CoA carboxylase biotin carboxyl carrier protein